MNSDMDVYQEAARLAEEGRSAEALGLLETHLQANPDDAQALNDAGAILYCMGRGDEAIERFERARTIMPDCGEIVWNLAEAYLALREGTKAAGLAPVMEQMGLLTPDLLNSTASVMLDAGDKAGAMEMLLRSLIMAPDQEVLEPMIRLIKGKRPKIAFFCGLGGDVKFLLDIISFCRERFEVRIFEGSTTDEMAELMKWCDIGWFEWCTQMAIEASRLLKTCRMIVRLHRFEAYQIWPTEVQWENVDKLVLVGNSAVKETLLAQVPDLERRTSVVTIPNGINLDRYRFRNRPRGRNIACIGYLNLRKNPMMLLQCMQKLRYIDPAYRLFFAGDFQDEMLRQYCMDMVQKMGLQDGVVFEGWQSDIDAWLEDKHYIVSGSIGESQGMGLLEGMACGLKPLIHRFPGVEEIFSAEYIFNIAEDFCRMIIEGDYNPSAYREYVEQRYPLRAQLLAINEIFTGMEAEIDSAKETEIAAPAATSTATPSPAEPPRDTRRSAEETATAAPDPFSEFFQAGAQPQNAPAEGPQPAAQPRSGNNWQFDAQWVIPPAGSDPGRDNNDTGA